MRFSVPRILKTPTPMARKKKNILHIIVVVCSLTVIFSSLVKKRIFLALDKLAKMK